MRQQQKSAQRKLIGFTGTRKKVKICTKNNDFVFVMCDFNAKVGCDHCSQVAMGSMLLESKMTGVKYTWNLRKRHDLMICNTWFKQHKGKLYTWVVSPGDRVRNDYINKRFKNSVKNCHTHTLVC